MSVINQMLKELEERNDPQGNNPNVAASQKQPVGLSKVQIALIILLIVLINIGGIYAWSLYSENQDLKQSVYNSSQIIADHEKLSSQEKQNTIIESVKTELPLIQEQEKRSVITHTDNKTVDHIVENQPLNKVKSITTQQGENAHQVHAVGNQTQQVKAVVKQEKIVITPLNDNISAQEDQKTLLNEMSVSKEKQASLSISRSHLSAERVVQNKLQKAERAITDNEVTKAEKLFEEVLLIQPEHKDARKQLSALWFGRKLYRPALNLLSQGMDIYPDDIDFRLMKARILLNQNNNKEALYVLNGFATAQHVEYQVLLANTAQLVGNSDSSILAYRQLVNLEPHQGKWWMGLAVALDRDSQFEKAKTAYKMALSTQSLSSNSAQFIRQRMSELGE